MSRIVITAATAAAMQAIDCQWKTGTSHYRPCSLGSGGYVRRQHQETDDDQLRCQRSSYARDMPQSVRRIPSSRRQSLHAVGGWNSGWPLTNDRLSSHGRVFTAKTTYWPSRSSSLLLAYKALCHTGLTVASSLLCTVIEPFSISLQSRLRKCVHSVTLHVTCGKEIF